MPYVHIVCLEGDYHVVHLPGEFSVQIACTVHLQPTGVSTNNIAKNRCTVVPRSMSNQKRSRFDRTDCSATTPAWYLTAGIYSSNFCPPPKRCVVRKRSRGLFYMLETNTGHRIPELLLFTGGTT